MLRKLLATALLCFAGMVGNADAQSLNLIKVTSCGTGSYNVPYLTVDATGTLCTAASVSASISGFAPTTTGTPISVTTGGVTGSLPAGAVVVATNVGTAQGAYCKLGASATTSDQYIAPNGGWFAFTVGANTQLTCITSTSTTTVNMVGGSGLPTGTGGGGGGSGGGGAVTMASGAVASGAYSSGSIASGAFASGSIGSGAVVDLGAIADAASTAGGTGSVNAKLRLMTTQLGTINTTLGSPFQAGGSIGNTSFGATQSGTWTVQPGNTANTTPWLTSISQGGNTAVVKGASTAASATDPAVVVAISPNGQNANGQATAANSSPVVLAKNTGTGATIAGAAVGTAGSAATEVVTVQGIASGTAIPVSGTVTATGTVAATQSGNWVMQPCTAYHLSGGTAASTNSTSMKASAGTLCRLTLINTQASTLGYLKVYDSATAPTCSSATNLKHVYPILAGPAGVQVIDGMGEVYSNGIAFCVTGGGGDTDNTNAPTGIYIEASYR